MTSRLRECLSTVVDVFLLIALSFFYGVDRMLDNIKPYPEDRHEVLAMSLIMAILVGVIVLLAVLYLLW